MNFKKFLIPATALSLALSGTAFAEKPEGKGNPHSRGSDSYRENSNRQLDEFSRRGKDRAEERHHLKELKKHKKKEHKFKKYKKRHDDYRDERYHDRRDGEDRDKRKHDRDESYRDNDRDRREKGYKNNRQPDRYQRQRNEELYRNDPVETIVKQNANKAKAKLNEAHRKAIEAIDNKTRELSNTAPQRDQTNPAKPWWSIFGNQ